MEKGEDTPATMPHPKERSAVNAVESPVRASTQEAVRQLVSLGLTEYEARAYAALVRTGESKAAAIHRESGVPRPALYGILRRLESRGLVDRTAGEPVRFRATPPVEALRRTRDGVDRAAGAALRALSELQRTRRPPPSRSLWFAEGHGVLVERLPPRLAHARKEILVFGYPPLVRRIRDDLEAAVERGVRVAVIDIGTRGRRRGVAPGLGARMIVGTLDGRAVFYGSDDAGTEEFAWSENPSFVRFIEGIFGELGSPVPMRPHPGTRTRHRATRP